jgi:hypothetical protein
MASVSAHKDKTMYVLIGEYGHWWLSTLATNRHDCYAAAKGGCRTADYKKELKADGFRCVAVKLKEVQELQKIAEDVADYLFTNGAGSKARRLVLELSGGGYGGGWCREAVVDAVIKVMSAQK